MSDISPPQTIAAFDPASIAALRDRLRGPALSPGDAGYNEARVVWNGMIDRRPGLIVRCAGAADVMAAVDFARQHRLLVAVHSGGHNVAGYAVCDGGLMIDLSAMRGVRVDPVARRAWVQGGATWADLDHETTAFGLATPGGAVSATGVAGLTLSGGLGWLRGKHGLALDNLVGVDVVTADGRLAHAGHAENADLFWAIRGGGGNFGVVVAFEFMLHPIEPTLMFSAPAYPEARAREVLAAWRDFMATAPDELSSLAEFSTVPDDPAFPEEARGQRVLSLAAVYDGPADVGEAVTRPMRDLGPMVADFSGRLPYKAIQSAYDALFPKGRDRCYWKSLYLERLDAEVIEAVVSGLARRPSETTFSSVWKFGAAMARVPTAATAFGDRSMPYMLSIDAIWATPGEDAANLAWTRGFWQAMRRYSSGRLYLNFPGLGEDGENLVRQALGAETFDRLAAIKRRYDPGNLFRVNQNIPPA